MPKRLLLFVLALILLVSPLSCTTDGSTGGASSVLPVEPGFYIIYERKMSHDIVYFELDQFGNAITKTHQYPFYVLMDTKNNLLGRVYGLEAPQYDYTKFYILHEDLQTIYNAVIKYDIKSLSSPNVLTVDGDGGGYYRITFYLEGGVYTVTYSDRVINTKQSYQNLKSFHALLDSYYMNTDEFQGFPAVTSTS